MGLTFRKRDDFDELMDGLGVSNMDLVKAEEKLELDTGKKEDPFARFLTPKTAEKADPFEKFLKPNVSDELTATGDQAKKSQTEK